MADQVEPGLALAAAELVERPHKTTPAAPLPSHRLPSDPEVPAAAVGESAVQVYQDSMAAAGFPARL
jgi:hypothetical protein